MSKILILSLILFFIIVITVAFLQLVNHLDPIQAVVAAIVIILTLIGVYIGISAVEETMG